jgi:hypothetical protein
MPLLSVKVLPDDAIWLQERAPTGIVGVAEAEDDVLDDLVDKWLEVLDCLEELEELEVLDWLEELEELEVLE